MKMNRLILGFVAVALAQSAVLGWMVLDRIRLLAQGREIVLPIVPIDPRSLFRGDYVTLSYAISQVPGAVTQPIGAAGGTRFRQNRVHVTIEQGADGVWTAVGLADQRPKPGETSGNRIVLKGRAVSWTTRAEGARVGVRYGIESFFVPEGKGLELERLARDKKLAAVIAVSRSGEVAIKGLMAEGKLLYQEPLF